MPNSQRIYFKKESIYDFHCQTCWQFTSSMAVAPHVMQCCDVVHHYHLVPHWCLLTPATLSWLTRPLSEPSNKFYHQTFGFTFPFVQSFDTKLTIYSSYWQILLWHCKNLTIVKACLHDWAGPGDGWWCGTPLTSLDMTLPNFCANCPATRWEECTSLDSAHARFRPKTDVTM